tara:strand:- start:163 stop:657 length:495 start_codon:yes stop_codon:yes gene_type:complete
LFYGFKKLFYLMKLLIKTLTKKNLKISVVESCTGGLFASSITSINGASRIFSLGLVTYSNQAKIKILKVDKNIIKKYGAVSFECCKEMVNKLSKISKANINVSITGIAGPRGGTKHKPVGLVYIGIKKDNKVLINRCLFRSRKRSSIQRDTVKKTLSLILRLIK